MTKRKSTSPPPLQIEVAGSRNVRGILIRTKGLLELIEIACNAARGDEPDGEGVADVFGPDLLKSLPQLCRFAACDLDLVELYLGADAASFHQNQLDEMAIETPGGTR